MSPRILIADPDDAVRTTWRVALEASGYQVLEAANGLDALRLLRSTQMDLAILEIIMPDQDGLGTILSIRKEGIHCVILATANPPAYGYLPIAELLGAAILRKPADSVVLLETVQRILR